MPGEEEERVGSSSSSSTQQQRTTNVTPSTTTTTTTSISTSASSRKNSSSLIETGTSASTGNKIRRGSSNTSAGGGSGGASGAGGGASKHEGDKPKTSEKPKGKTGNKRVDEEEKAKAKVADAIAKSLLKTNRPASLEADHHHKHRHHHHHHHQHSFEQDCPSQGPLIDLHGGRTHGPNKIPRVPHHPPPLPPPLLPIIGKGTLGRGDEGDGELDLLGSSSSTTTGEEESRLELELQFAGVDVEALELDEDDSNFPQGEIIKRRAEPEDTKVGLDDDDPGSTLHGPVNATDLQQLEHPPDGEGEGEDGDKPPAPGPAVVVPPTLKEKCLFYTTAFFILLAIFSLFAFLFLVPFVIDPAFSTIFKEFDPVPTLCYTQDVIDRIGSSNCSWTSCREGCTREVFNCTQIIVRYRVGATSNASPLTSAAFKASSSSGSWSRSKRSVGNILTDETGTGVRWINNSQHRNHNNNYYDSFDDEDSIRRRMNSKAPFFYQQMTSNNNFNSRFSRSHYSYYFSSSNYYQQQQRIPGSASSSSSSSKSGSIQTSSTTDDRNIHRKKKHKAVPSPLALSLSSSPYSAAALKSSSSSSSSSSMYYYSPGSSKRSSDSSSSTAGSWFEGAHLFPNVRGCGYPPVINCTNFLSKYGRVGRNFSCYYSKVDPKIVVTNFSMNRILFELALSMAIPIPCFIISVIYIVFAYFKIYAPTTEATSSSCQTANANAAADATTLPTEQITNNNIASPSRHLPGGGGTGPGSSQDDLDLETSLTTDEKTRIIQRSTSRGLNAVSSRLPNSKGSQHQGQVIIQMNDLAPNSRNPDAELLLPAPTNNNRNGRAPERNGPTNPAKNKGKNMPSQNHHQHRPEQFPNRRKSSKSILAIAPSTTIPSSSSVQHSSGFPSFAASSSNKFASSNASILTVIPNYNLHSSTSVTTIHAEVYPATSIVMSSSPTPSSYVQPTASKSLNLLNTRLLEPGYLPEKTKSLPPIDIASAGKNSPLVQKHSHVSNTNITMENEQQGVWARDKNSSANTSFIDKTIPSFSSATCSSNTSTSTSTVVAQPSVVPSTSYTSSVPSKERKTQNNKSQNKNK